MTTATSPGTSDLLQIAIMGLTAHQSLLATLRERLASLPKGGQRRLADLTGIPAPCISDLNRGASGATLATIKRLLDGLDRMTQAS